MTMAPSLAPVVRTAHGHRISDRVFDTLSTAIRSLRLAPGAVLSETELAQQLGVSRTPLREAISRLVEQGLIHVTPQVGTTVALIDVHGVEEATFIRAALETAAFRLAVERRTPISNVRAALEEHKRARAAGDLERFLATDDALHQAIFDLSGFPHAWNVVSASRLQLDRVRRLILPESIKSQSIFEEHTRIVDLLEAGDVPQGVSVVAAHAQQGLRLLPRLREANPAFFADTTSPGLQSGQSGDGVAAPTEPVIAGRGSAVQVLEAGR